MCANELSVDCYEREPVGGGCMNSSSGVVGELVAGVVEESAGEHLLGLEVVIEDIGPPTIRRA